ncbi:MAG: CehA/McbA family metallohydrolase [Candidatus Binatia bacterium]
MSKHLLCAVVVVLAASPAWAVLSLGEQGCQKKAAAQSRAFFKGVAKALEKCHDKVSAGSLPPTTDCSLEATTAAKISAARTKLSAKIAPACPDAKVVQLVFGGDCFGVDTAASLATCLADTHEDRALALMATLYGAGGAVGSPQVKCQKAAAGASIKYAASRLTALQKCKDQVSKGTLLAGTDCAADVTTAAKITAAESKAIATIGAKCPDTSVVALALGKPCTGAATGARLSACAVGTHRDGADALVVVEYGQGATGGTALARQITNPTADCVRGPLSRCRTGDYLLQNDKIRVVVQDIQRNLFGIGQFGGQIIDADLNRGNPALERDNFEEWAVALNIENTAHYTNVTIVNDGSDGQAAVIRVTGVDDLLDFLNPSSVVTSFGLLLGASQDDRDLAVEIQTDYILEPGTNWVRVQTTIVNVGPTPESIFVGEFLNGSGQVHLFQPANGFGSPTVTGVCPSTAANPCNFVAYSGYKDATGVSYGYVHEEIGSVSPPKSGSSTFTTSGVTVPILGMSVVNALIGAPANFPLAASGNPGDSLTFDRWFVVGDGSVSSITDARNHFQYLGTGTVSGTVTLGGSPVAGAQVTVLGSLADAPGSTGKNVVTQALTDGTGAYTLTLAPGTYTVEAAMDGAPYEGGGSTPLGHAVTVAAYGTVTQNLALPATGAIRVLATDEASLPIPAKASIVGFDPSPDPKNTQTVLIISSTTNVFSNLGADGLPFGLAKTLFIDPSGDSGTVALEPGTYQVVVSRGPEYSVDKQTVVVTAGSTTTVTAEVARIIDSTGFVGSDFHVHSIESPDSQISRHDRVVTMLAEGVDFFTPSDHDIRTNYTPDIAAIPGASSLVGTVPSGEITTFDYGHFNAWPMTIDTTKVNGGSVDFGGAAPNGQDFPSFGNYSLTPAQIVAAGHADPGASNTVQINHIHSHFGLDGGSGLAIDTGATPPQSAVPGAARRLDPAVTNYFTPTFDALEVWIGDDRPQVYTNFLGQNAGDWFNLLNQGYRRTGVADSDTHQRIVGQAGIPRTFVASPTDIPAALAAIGDTLSANVNDGRAFGTNGPIVRVRVTAGSTGQEGRLELGWPTQIATTDGEVDVQVDIQSPDWAEFDKVEYYVNSTTTCSATSKQSGAGMVSVKRYAIAPDYVQTAPTDFTVSTDEVVPGHTRLEASTSLTLSGLTQDVWIVVMVKGTDGLSKPLFPVIPNSLKQSTNLTVANLADGNLGEDGMTALAFTNPIYVDVNADGWVAPGVQTIPCP